MTKEDFKKKYHGKSVKIEPSMQVQHLGEIAERQMLNKLKEQAEDVEFEEIQG